MGSVQLCEDLVLRSRAAVKVLRSTGSDMRRRFRDEATLLANLRHPHLVQVLAVGETEEGFPYIAMEHLGESLDRTLRDKHTLHWREALAIGVQIAEALSTLHRAGVVHRDVKPANIAALRGVTGRVFVKLIDLGVARVEDLASLQQGGSSLPPRRRTKEGKILGTPGYTPPEAGVVEPDARFDVYGLGATIFELCTGVVPDVLDPCSMRSIKPKLPKELDKLISRAIEVVPESRIATADELAKGLAKVIERYPEGSEAPLFDGCYELIQLLGIGAKAEVHWAYHRDARRFVALKLLRDEVLDDAEERERFDREARILSAIDHPSIPTLVDCRTGASSQRPFIAMELCPGQRATEFQQERLSPREVISVGQQLASALAALHEKGIIHRDLNQSNVLIERSDGEVRASVIDLGQADLLDEFYAGVSERYPTPPEGRTRLGSGGLEHAQWTAPEARSLEGWTTKSDIFSLGLLLFILLTGKVPIKEETGRWTSPVDFVPESEGPLAEAILGSLQADPSFRFDAKGLLDRLAEAESDAQLLALEELRLLEANTNANANANANTNTVAKQGSDPAGTRRRLRVAGGVVGVAGLCLLSWSIGRSSLPSRAAESPSTEVMTPSVFADSPRRDEGARESALSGSSGSSGSSDIGTTTSIPATHPSEPDADAPALSPPEATSDTGPQPVSRAMFRRQVHRHQVELDKCLRRHSPIEVRVWLSRDGKVARADTGDASPLVDLCLRDVLGALDFPGGAPSSHRIKIGGQDG